MDSNNDHSFGKAVAKLRESKGFLQKEVVERLGGFYSDERAYRRVESGDRKPGRKSAIAILRCGLKVDEVDLINQLLALARYEPLSAAEMIELGLEPNQGQPIPVAIAIPSKQLGSDSIRQPLSRTRAALTLSLDVLCVMFILLKADNYGVSIAVATLYAALYPVSLLLESVYEPDSEAVTKAAVYGFAFIHVTSALALVANSYLIRAGSELALLSSFLFFLVAAILQGAILRNVLSDQAVVAIRFQAHTAQAAHLKNTIYFIIVIMFCLPPVNCISILQRESRLGHVEFVRAMVDRHVLLGRGIFCLSPGLLLVVFILLGFASLVSGAHLTENLRPHPQLNEYTTWLYVRAILAFSLCVFCLAWYAYSIGALI